MLQENDKMVVDTNSADVLENNKKNFSNSQVTVKKPLDNEVVCQQSRYLVFEFIYNVLGEKSPIVEVWKRKCSYRCVKKLLRMTTVMLERHNIPFKSACLKMKLSKDAPIKRMLQSIASEMFHSGCNWGRITALFALCRKLAVNCKEQGFDNHIHSIIVCLADILTGQLSTWIVANGGWDGYADYFRDSEDVQEDVKKFLLYTTVALTVSFALVLALWERW